MDCPEYIPRDKGARNVGYRYETQVMVLLASHWTKEDSIEDFWIVTSPSGLEKFDDIVAVLKTSDGSRYVLMGQIKHSKKKMNLTFDEKQIKKGFFDIDLKKHFKGYTNIVTKKYTNEVLKEYLIDIPQDNFYWFLFVPMEATNELIEIRISENNPVKYLDVRKSAHCFQYKQDVPDEYKQFFQDLYFFVGQDNSDAIYKSLQDSILGERFTSPMIDTLCDFIDDYMNNGDYCSPLTKSIFWNKCVEVRLSYGMEVGPINERLKEEYFKLWDDVFTTYNVIKIDEIGSVLSLIYSYYEYKIRTLYDSSFDWNECCKNNQHVKVKIKATENNGKEFYHLLDVLRFMANRKEVPWIVQEKYKSLVLDFKDGISNNRFITAFNIEDQHAIPEGTRLFYNALHLRGSMILYTIRLSLQGKHSRPLAYILGGNYYFQSDDVLEAIRPVHLLRWTSENDQNNIIGKILPKPNDEYITRTFSCLFQRFLHYGQAITETNLISLLNRHISVISSDAGMGKSTTLKSLARYTNPEDYVISWNLSHSMQDIESENSLLYQNPLDYFFTKCEGIDADPLVRTIFEYQKKSGRLIVLIDSYDEMLPLYGEKVLNILDIISKDSIRVVITTRPYAEALLRKRFPRIDCIHLNGLSNKVLLSYCEKYNITKNIQRSFPRNFLKVPLHLSMLKYVVNDKDFNGTTLTKLYEHFISEKIRIYFEKNNISKNYQMQQIKKILKAHVLIAARHMFKSHKMLIENIITNDEWDDIVDEPSVLNAVGIVCLLNGDKIHFVHQTYAEYLTAKWMFENKSKTKDLLNIVVEDDHYKKMFKFLVEMNILVDTRRYSFPNENPTENDVLKKDEWNLLPLHWAAISFHFSKRTADIFKTLLLRTVKAVPDVNVFINQNIRMEKIFSSELWLKHACDFEGPKLLKCLLKTHHLNANIIIKCDDGFQGSLLHYCCRRKYWVKAKILLCNGSNPNLRDEHGATSLHLACLQKLEVVKLLLESGADPNLVDNKLRNSLHYAFATNKVDIVRLLLEYNANPNQQDIYGRAGLNLACRKQHQSIVRILLAKGADPNLKDKTGLTSLHLACLKKLEIIKLLLESGADPNIVDKKGRNSLHYAIAAGKLDQIHLLLEYNANPNQQDYKGEPVLNLACRQQDQSIVQILLEKGADPNLVDNNGMNSLLHACKVDNLEIVRLLLDHNVNINHHNNRGETGLSIACLKGNAKLIRLLCQSLT